MSINNNETKLVTLYSYDHNNVFTESFEYLWATGTGLAANSTLESPESLPTLEGYVKQWDGDTWSNVVSHLGKTVYSTTDKQPKEVDYVGEIQEGYTLLEPSIYGTWDGEKWVDLRTEEEILLAKRQSMPRLNQRQFRKILRDNGIFEQAKDFVYSSGNGYIEDAWEFSEYFDRLDPLLIQAMSGLGLTDEQVDSMWESAQQREGNKNE